MKKTIQLSVEQAKSLYATNPELRETILNDFTNEELGITPILRDWEALEYNKPTFYPRYDGIINIYRNSKSNLHLNVPTEKHAKSMLAFAKLSMLMNDLGDECDVDWEDMEQRKNIIEREGREINSDWHAGGYHFLAFKKKSVRDAFLDKHRNLIEEYFMI